MTIHYPETLTIKIQLFVPNTVLATHTPPETCHVQSTVTHSVGNFVTRQFNTPGHPMDTTLSQLHFALNTTMSQLHFPLDTILSQLNLHWVDTIMSELDFPLDKTMNKLYFALHTTMSQLHFLLNTTMSCIFH